MRRLILASAALAIMPQSGSAQDARRQAPDCAKLAADVEALNARLTSTSGAVAGRLRSSLQDQAEARAKADRDRRSVGASGLATGLLGSVVPGGDMLGMAAAAAMRRGSADASDGAPPSGDTEAAIAELAAQGEAANRLSAAFQRYRASGCAAR